MKISRRIDMKMIKAYWTIAEDRQIVDYNFRTTYNRLCNRCKQPVANIVSKDRYGFRCDSRYENTSSLILLGYYSLSKSQLKF